MIPMYSSHGQLLDLSQVDKCVFFGGNTFNGGKRHVDKKDAIVAWKVMNCIVDVPNVYECRGYKFAVGNTYSCDEEIELCVNGFHCCLDVKDCFRYYSYDTHFIVVTQVRIWGDVDVGDFGDKICGQHIEVIQIVPWEIVSKLCNPGLFNKGISNRGDNNVGSFNHGNGNKGDYNRGSLNVGDHNHGMENIGDHNIGSSNIGVHNHGYTVEGIARLSGQYNIGHYNRGCCNIGNQNYGILNISDNSYGIANSQNNLPKLSDGRMYVCNNIVDISEVNLGYLGRWMIQYVRVGLVDKNTLIRNGWDRISDHGVLTPYVSEIKNHANVLIEVYKNQLAARK